MRRVLLQSAVVALFLPGQALAGMPMIRLTDLARMRFQSLSFFLVGFLLCSFLIQRLWNWLGRDFPTLPRLSYGRALGLVGLWGLLFVLVLTMISGARELMTPGAWKKEGFTYKLADRNRTEAGWTETVVDAIREQEEVRGRQQDLRRLADALWDHARNHEGRFPASLTDPAQPPSLHGVPGTGSDYIYFGGTRTEKDGRLLALEPETHAGERWVLRTDGTLRLESSAAIRAALAQEQR